MCVCQVNQLYELEHLTEGVSGKHSFYENKICTAVLIWNECNGGGVAFLALRIDERQWRNSTLRSVFTPEVVDTVEHFVQTGNAVMTH